MALQELKQRLSRYFYGENAGADASSKQSAGTAAPSEIAIPLKDLSNFTAAPKASVSAPSSPIVEMKESPTAGPSETPATTSNAPKEPAPVSVAESPTIKRLQSTQRPKRRASFGPKAEPLSKRLWRKKERERLRELDEQIRSCALLIAEKEAQHRHASQLMQTELCEDLSHQLDELIELKLNATREKADLRNQITRKSRSASAKYRTL